MLDIFRRLFKKDKPEEVDTQHISVPESEIGEELKRHIAELEKEGEEWGGILQQKYAGIFENQGKKNLRIWVCRDIDGDEEEELTSEYCLEKEYRSQLAIDYDGPKFDDEFYAHTIYLWYYYGGYFKGSGTLYDLSANNLEADIEEALNTLLREF